MKKHVDAETFVRTWQNAETVADVARDLGITAQSATARAAAYRKRGVNLKRFPKRGGARLNVDALNDLIGE